MGDIVKPVAQWISQNIPWTILIVCFFISLTVEISKVKVYPLKWLWKLISWPFKKIDEQRTASFKAIAVDLKADIDGKVTQMLSGMNSNCELLKTRFDRMESRFDELDKMQQDTDERLDKLAAARIKNHVLNFARQCRKGEPHSHEDFANLIKENSLYESLVQKYQKSETYKKEWENNVYVHDYAYIMKVYDKCLENNDFLGQ